MHYSNVFRGQIKPEFPVWSTHKASIEPHQHCPSLAQADSERPFTPALQSLAKISSPSLQKKNSWILGWFRVSMRNEGSLGDRRHSHRLTSTPTVEHCRQGSGRPVRRISVPSEQSRHHLWTGIWPLFWSKQKWSTRTKGKKKPVSRGKTIFQW